MRRPRAVLLDLDDTLVNDTGHVAACWGEACDACHAGLFERSIDRATLLASIRAASDWFWSDPERNRLGRLDLREARREVARLSFHHLGIDAPALAVSLGDSYTDRRHARLELLPAAIDTLSWLQAHGCRLALLTNGSGAAQREKLARFALTDLFDTVLIEGELGFGKPDPRVYAMALRELAADPVAAWMVGDNLEFDVAVPQRLGLVGVWVDAAGAGLPEGHSARPDRIVRSIGELPRLLEAGLPGGRAPESNPPEPSHPRRSAAG
jgi:putative hydrolase of the HAD superfamily